MPANELVLGASVNGASQAYVLSDFNGLTAINDMLGGLPVVILIDSDAGVALAYLAAIDGNLLNFLVADGAFLDEGGSAWDINGRASSGPLAGTELTFVTSS